MGGGSVWSGTWSPTQFSLGNSKLSGVSDKLDRDTKGSAAGLKQLISYFPEDEPEFDRFAWEWGYNVDMRLYLFSQRLGTAPDELVSLLKANSFRRGGWAGGRQPQAA